ncbi:MAG: hypothetical protein IKW02_02655 [Clostridia bacterium]|nr:hypothetical protein [Clostridia bacterium]
MDKNRKNNVVSNEEHYTNLMLIVVAEAMVLLITQMLIFNGFKYAAYVAPVMNGIVPVILAVAAVIAAASAVLWFVKKKNALISLVFSTYIVLLMCVIRYIPNEFSQALGRPIANYLKGQKIGAALSVVYVVAGILYCILAERKRRNQKNK